MSAPELTQKMFDTKNMTVVCDPQRSRYLTVTALLRGRMPMKGRDEQALNIQTENSSHLVNWIPDGARMAVYIALPPGHEMSATLVRDRTAIRKLVERVSEQSLAMVRQKTFLHRYTVEGMGETKITEAGSNASNLIRPRLCDGLHSNGNFAQLNDPEGGPAYIQYPVVCAPIKYFN